MRDKGDQIIDQINIPPGAKEYVDLAKKWEDSMRTVSYLYLKELEQGQLSEEELNQGNDALNKMNEYRGKLDNIRKTVQPNFGTDEYYNEVRKKYEK